MSRHRASACAVVLLLLCASSGASGQMLQFGSFGNLTITNSSGALRLDGAHIEPGTRFAELAITLWSRAEAVYELSMANGPAGSTVGLDFLALQGGSVTPTGNPLRFVFHPTAALMTFKVLVQSVNPYNAGGIYPEIIFSSTLNAASSSRFNVPLVLNPNAVSTPIVLEAVSYPSPVDLFAGGSISGGNGGGVSAPVTSAPGSTVSATGGTLSLGDGSAPVVLNGTVDVAADATLNLVSSGPAVLGGQTEINHGTVQVTNADSPGLPGRLILGSDVSQEATAQLAQLIASQSTYSSTLLAAQGQSQISALTAIAAQLQAIQSQIIALQGGPQSPAVQAQLLALQHQAAVANAESIQAVSQMQHMQDLASAISDLTSAAISSIQGVLLSTTANVRSTIEADVTLTAATMNIGGPGAIDHTDILGGLTVQSGGVLGMEFAGTGTGLYDTMTISGDAVFAPASVLRFDLLTPGPMFSPAFLETFDLLTAASVTLNGLMIFTNDPRGTIFGSSVIDNLDGTQTLRITAVPTPGAAALLGLAAGTAALRRRRR